MENQTAIFGTQKPYYEWDEIIDKLGLEFDMGEDLSDLEDFIYDINRLKGTQLSAIKTSRDYIAIGRDIGVMEDDETLREFKEKAGKELKKAFGLSGDEGKGTPQIFEYHGIY